MIEALLPYVAKGMDASRKTKLVSLGLKTYLCERLEWQKSDLVQKQWDPFLPSLKASKFSENKDHCNWSLAVDLTEQA